MKQAFKIAVAAAFLAAPALAQAGTTATPTAQTLSEKGDRDELYGCRWFFNPHIGWRLFCR